MRNPQLKEMFLQKCNSRMKLGMEQAFKLEDTFGRNIFELGYDDAVKMVEMMDEDKKPTIRLLQVYTGFAIRNGYSTTNINVFDVIQ